MSTKLASFIAFVLTYAITRLGQAFFHFKPTRDLSFWLGVAVDFAIWFLIFSLTFWAFSKLFVKKTPV